jgi:cytochrome c oxidase subunit 3
MMPLDGPLARAGREPALTIAPQFADAGQQREAAALGMWIFLATEVMFFGALFFAYAIARVQFPAAFAAASRHTNIVLGTTNTAVLLTSSLFMALAVRSAAHAARKATALLLVITAFLGVTFAGIKLTEYALDYRATRAGH